MNLPPFIKQLNETLKGWPDTWLTALLIMLAVIIVIVALHGSPLLKATVAAWVIAP